MSKPCAVIFDMDGTLAAYERPKKVDEKSVKKYLSGLDDAKANDWAVEMLRAFKMRGYKIIVLTGRNDGLRNKTSYWIHKQCCMMPHDFELIMRPIGDLRSDVAFKQEALADIVHRFNVTLAVDDRKCVAQMFRFFGIPTMLCDDYEETEDGAGFFSAVHKYFLENPPKEAKR